MQTTEMPHMSFHRAVLACGTDGAFDIEAARTVLRSYPPRKGILVLYGELLQRVLERIERRNVASRVEDVDILLGYIRATQALPEEERMSEFAWDDEAAFEEANHAANEYDQPDCQGLEFCRVFMRLSIQAEARKRFPTKPYYDQLSKVLGALSTDAGIHRVHPTLMLALHRERTVFDTMLLEWETPTPQELEYFDSMHANGWTEGKVRPMHALIGALSSAMTQRMWQPTCLAQHLLVWELYNPRRERGRVFTADQEDDHEQGDDEARWEEDDAREARLIGQLLTHYPNQHRHAFETLAPRIGLGPQAARSLFPIRIPTHDIAAFSKALVKFFLGHKDCAVFEQELQEQHPELWRMLNMYAQIYSETQEALDNAGLLVEPMLQLSSLVQTVNCIELPLLE